MQLWIVITLVHVPFAAHWRYIAWLKGGPAQHNIEYIVILVMGIGFLVCITETYI